MNSTGHWRIALTKPRKLQTAVQITGSIGEIAMFFMGYFSGMKVWWAMGLVLFVRILIKLVTSELMFHRQRSNLDERVGIIQDRLMSVLGIEE